VEILSVRVYYLTREFPGANNRRRLPDTTFYARRFPFVTGHNLEVAAKGNLTGKDELIKIPPKEGVLLCGREHN
jgi:hypothetical protein